MAISNLTFGTPGTGLYGSNPFGTPTAPSSTDDPSRLQTVLNILGSKGGQTAVAAAGAGLQAYGQAKQASANRAQNAQQFNAQMANDQLNSDRTFGLNQATAAAAADPLGAEQSFAQKQALAKMLLGGARNFSVTPGDPAVAASMGTISGGMRLPEGGIDPSMLEKLFGDQATMASLAQRAKTIGQINPNAPVMDMTSMYGANAQPTMNDIVAANKLAADKAAQDTARQRAIIQQALDGTADSKSSSGGGAKSAIAKAALGLGTAYLGSKFGGGGGGNSYTNLAMSALGSFF